MHGSLKTLLTAIIRAGCRFGHSRHKSKRDFDGSSPFLHSIGSFDRVIHRLWPLIRWMQEHGVDSFESLDYLAILQYLSDRLSYHLSKDNDRHTFQVELSALANLERCLTLFYSQHRATPTEYDFSQALKTYRSLARTIPKKDREVSRALPRPMDVIACLEIPKHILMAEIQYRCGCRAEGVGAPQREYPGSNRLSLDNFMLPASGGEILPVLPDPITRLPVYRFWTIEKGGKLAWKHCPLPLGQKFFQYCSDNPEGLTERYPVYLTALNKAMKETDQYEKGRGTHSLRFAFAQNRYLACVNSGMGDEAAKLFVSREMSHNRPDVTGEYLG